MRLIPTLLALTLATTGWAEIRVYQPANTPAPSHETPAETSAVRQLDPATADAATTATRETSQKDATFRKQVEETWQNLMSHYGGDNTQAELIVYLHTDDYSSNQNDGIKRLLESEELQKLGLKPVFYMNNIGFSGVRPQLAQKISEVGEEIEIVMDQNDTIAETYGVGRQSVIIYRDPTGAVRLYNLPYEVDKLERQLARQISEAQTSTP